MSSTAARSLPVWGRRARLVMLAGWTPVIVLAVLNELGLLDSHQGLWNALRIVATVTWVSAGALFLLAVYRARIWWRVVQTSERRCPHNHQVVDTKIRFQRSRLFAALLAGAGVWSLIGSWPFGFQPMAGIFGLAFASAAMRQQRTVRWPLGLGAVASAGAATAWLPWPSTAAGGTNEFFGAYFWFGCSALMLGFGVVAVIWSLLEEPWPGSSELSARSAVR